MPHTTRDAAVLTAAGVDPTSRQPRERATSCGVCRAETWHLRPFCDAHYREPDTSAVPRRTVRAVAA